MIEMMYGPLLWWLIVMPIVISWATTVPYWA